MTFAFVQTRHPMGDREIRIGSFQGSCDVHTRRVRLRRRRPSRGAEDDRRRSALSRLQRVGQREPLRRSFSCSSPFSAVSLPRKRIPRHGRVFLEPRDLHAGVENRGHGLAEPAGPHVCDRRFEDGVGLDVRAALIYTIGSGVSKYGSSTARTSVRFSSIAQSIGWPSRMNSPPPGPQCGDDLRPAVNIGKPADRADAGVHEVEPLPAEHIWRVVEVGDDELRIGAGRLGELTGGLDRRLREIEPGHAAPSRASETVSVPMWHCRWTPASLETSRFPASRTERRGRGTPGRR